MKGGNNSEVIYLGLFFFISQKPAILGGMCRFYINCIINGKLNK